VLSFFYLNSVQKQTLLDQFQLKESISFEEKGKKEINARHWTPPFVIPGRFTSLGSFSDTAAGPEMFGLKMLIECNHACIESDSVFRNTVIVRKSIVTNARRSVGSLILFGDV